MKTKPTIDPAEGWAMVIAPTLVGEVVAVTAKLENPDGRVVASVVVERPEQGGLEAATRNAGNLLKEMLRLGEDRSDAGGSKPAETRKKPQPQPTPEGAAEFPDPDETQEVEPMKVTPLNKEEPSLDDRPLAQKSVETAPNMDANEPPTEGDLQALEDACEAEGVIFVKPDSHGQAIDWMVGVREGRYESLPPTAEDTEAAEDQEAPAESGEEAVNG